MRKLRAWFSRMFQSLLPIGRARRERDLADELEAHLAMHIEDNLRAGMTPDEARRQAMLRLGGVDQTKERYRDRLSLPWLDSLFADIRYASRVMVRGRGFTVALILILALGIGGVTAMYAVVDGVMLRPLPFAHPGQLMTADGLMAPAQIDPVQYWGHNAAFDQIAFSGIGGVSVRIRGTTERATVALVSYTFFPILGVQPLIGRCAFSQKDGATFAPIAVVSYDFWTQHFAKDRSALGKTILISDHPYTIIGVMPASFRFPEGADLWIPASPFRSGPIQMGTVASTLPPSPGVIGRLKPGVTIAQADAIMKALSLRLQAQYGSARNHVANDPRYVEVHPLQETMVGNVRTLLFVLLGGVAFVLLIVCANAANMLLARAAVRQKEIALRLCLGATRLRVVRQLLTESVLLALIGGGLGVLFARWFVGVFRALAPANIPRMAEVAIDPRVLGVVLAISSITGIVLGLAPAIQSLAPELTRALKIEGQRSTGGMPRFFRGALVVIEVALSLVLVSGAGLMLQSLYRMMETPLHFNPKNVVTMDLDIPQSKFMAANSSPPASSGSVTSLAEQKREAEQQAESRREADAALERFNQRILDKTRRIPGVLSAATVSALPFAGRWGGLFVYPEGKQFKDAGMGQIVQVSGDYFRAMGVSLTAGRTFTREEELSGADVIILGENLARGLWPHGNPIGQRLIVENNLPGTPMEIVGVAPELTGDFRGQRMTVPVGEMYLPGSGGALGTLVVRTTLNPTSMISPIRQAVLSIDPDLTAYNARTMEDVISTAAGPQTFRALILGFFAVMALVIAILGVYGVMAYAVACRTHEIGVRISLGASPRNILQLIVVEGIRLALIGVALGFALAIGLNRIVASLLFDTSPTDPVALAIAGSLLLAGALAACLIPARRAMRVDPMTALRYE